VLIEQTKKLDKELSWIISIPIIINKDEEVLGNLSVFSKLDSGFLDEEIKMLEDLARDIGIALNSVFQQTKLKSMELEKISNYEETILAFVNIIEQRDSYTAGHTIRVAQYCRLIAQDIGLKVNDILKLEKAAILHDIGKVVTPDAILLKPGKLLPLEYNLIKEHSEAGYKMLSKIKMYSDLADIIKYHHSNYDGTGYPYVPKNRLKNISILSHILMIADAFDAMTSNRIYKSRRTIDEAIEELKLNSGTQFHPDLVKNAIRALSHVKLEDTTQLPNSELEERRFAYFFMDSLTDLYNEDYLRIQLAKNSNYNRCLTVIELNHFSSYNDKYGWKNGNQFLKDFASYLKDAFSEATIFRCRGNDFVLIFKEHYDVKAKAFTQFSDENIIEYKLKHYDLKDKIPDLFS
jgi:putative nucleotidyltransferase with HDIG domain